MMALTALLRCEMRGHKHNTSAHPFLFIDEKQSELVPALIEDRFVETGFLPHSLSQLFPRAFGRG
jgi:hypothetical protein